MSYESPLYAVADAAVVVCPISFFDSVTDAEPYLSGDFPWGKLLGILGKHAAQQFPSKEAAPLLSPTLFDKSYRLAANVTRAGLVVVDVDHGEIVEDARNKLAQAALDAVVYTTASSRPGDERFRVLVPLRQPVDAITYTLGWASIVSFLGIKPDGSKKTAESLFYLPGTYPEATNRFEHTVGAIQSADWWINTFPVHLPVDPPPRQATAPKLKAWRRATGLYELPYVRSEWIREYLDLMKGEHYCGLFKFMIRVAMSAIAQGYAISEADLVDLARDLDASDVGGPWYSRRPLAREAGNALAFALCHSSPPTSSGLKNPATLCGRKPI